MRMINPLLTYRGGKHYLLKDIQFIYDQVPVKKNILVDVFGGSGQVLMNLDANIKIYNDIDDLVYNVFFVIINNKNELINKLQNTIISRKLFNIYKNNIKTNDPVETAFRYIYVNTLSYAGRMDYPTFYYISHRKFLKLPELIDEYYKIIRGWILENDDFRNIIPRYDSNDTIFYLDPPYLGWSWYNHNFTEKDMRDLKGLLDNISGKYIMNVIYSEKHVNIFGEPQLKKTYTSNLDRSRTKRIEAFYVNYDFTI